MKFFQSHFSKIDQEVHVFLYGDALYHLILAESPIRHHPVAIAYQHVWQQFIQNPQFHFSYCQTSLDRRAIKLAKGSTEHFKPDSLAAFAEQCVQGKKLLSPSIQAINPDLRAVKKALFVFDACTNMPLVMQEWLELAYMLAAYGMKIDLLFKNEAYTLLKEETGNSLFKMLLAVTEYDIENIYVMLNHTNASVLSAKLPTKIILPAQEKELLARYDCFFTAFND